VIQYSTGRWKRQRAWRLQKSGTSLFRSRQATCRCGVRHFVKFMML
jgi:hypothetical protein